CRRVTIWKPRAMNGKRRSFRRFARAAPPENHATLPQFLLRQPAPRRGEATAITGRGAIRFDGALEEVAGRGRVAEGLQRHAVVVQTFGIVGAAFGVDHEFVACVFELTGADVDRREFAQRLAGIVALVLIDDRLEVREGLAETTLFAGDAAE